VLTENKKQWQIKRCLWPAGQSFAAVFTHNVDKLQKWSIGEVLLYFPLAILHLLTFRFVVFFRNFLSICRLLFRHIEDYWNFYKISQIEKKHKFRSTWFIGVNKNKRKTYDYEYNDQSLLRELAALMGEGNEISLLYNHKNKNIEEMRKDLELLNSKAKSGKAGIRHVDYLGAMDTLDRDHCELDLLYDSSRYLPERNGFYNGFALPYPLFNRIANSDKPDIYEFPINLTDTTFRLTKSKYINYSEALNIVKTILNTVKTGKGLLHFSMTNSLFYEIKYMPKLIDHVLEDLKNQNVYSATIAEMSIWLHKRNKIDITEEENKVTIRFPEAIEQITFEIMGCRKVVNVIGGCNNFNKNFVQFVNVPVDLVVEIELATEEDSDA
jgi:hypothetical protein